MSEKSEEQILREQYEQEGKIDSPDDSSESGCGRYLYVFLGIALVFLLASVWNYFSLIGTFASSHGMLNIYNDANVELDTQAIETAAQKLRENFGINIEIFIVQSTANPEPYSNLANFVYQRDYGTIPANNLVILIGIDDQYSEMSWGENLNRLDGERLRGEVLNPRLNERDYTGALVRTFEASTERLQDGNLAFQALLNGYTAHLDIVIIVALVIGGIWLLFNLQSQGMFPNNSGSSYRNWRSSSFGSSSSSQSSNSSSSSHHSGGSSRGSWKD